MFWNWLTEFFTAPARVQELEKTLMGRNIMLDEVRNKLAACQSEKSRMFNELNLAITDNTSKDTVIQDLKIQLEDKDVEIQALKDSQTSTDSDKDRLIKELTATASRRQGTIDNLIKQRDEARNITPESLTAYLLAKYPQGTDVSKIWDDYAEAIDEVFAVKLIDPVKEISGNEFKDSIIKAFPEVKFNSMLMDNIYFCPSCADIIRVIRNDWGNLQPYVPQRGDCNWFAERLRIHFNKIYLLNVGILMVGMAPFGLHAWSIIKGYDGIVICEPQNDLVVIFPETIEGYIPQEIIIA